LRERFSSYTIYYSIIQHGSGGVGYAGMLLAMFLKVAVPWMQVAVLERVENVPCSGRSSQQSESTGLVESCASSLASSGACLAEANHESSP
jgi:hypothetical protein